MLARDTLIATQIYLIVIASSVILPLSLYRTLNANCMYLIRPMAETAAGSRPGQDGDRHNS